MKKRTSFLIWFFVLIILGGSAFFFGWMQFSVPAGSYGVMLSKSGGYHDKLIVPGEFMWRWERLVPTNSKILTFNLKPQEIEYKTEGVLPSADKFGLIMEQKSDFRWKFALKVSAAAKPESLIGLVKNASIKTQSDLDDFIRTRVEEAAQKSANGFIEYFLSNTEEYEKLKFQYSAFNEKIASDIKTALNNEIEIVSVELSSDFLIPDLKLYMTIRDVYSEYEKAKSKVFTELMVEEGKTAAASKFRMNDMKEWGELLKQYPQLIDFLAVARSDASETLKALRELKAKINGAQAGGNQAGGTQGSGQ
ncbi:MULTISPECIES: SPFH domain-containing protein [unclassified Treponema]|uniref:SPFH domain-containing protein n=1 Tax=unclassified Treponema TaxID=2638727 RepID=UPI0020A4F800|nr:MULTISPECIES: SPFH domain-containing protein [unclassified Treponema]UTC67407.1 hypothetical protein E4O06_01685 [Treponema sp. OMZ 789]UTC70135.1 hypothetical protein E4O01_01680 [Treponema sp. OMZ 790]UTC72850.1 hypothetical protein E4O02_01680 [Treponema sp. OMZ 791]